MKKYTQIRDIASFKSGLLFITLGEPCNSSRSIV